VTIKYCKKCFLKQRKIDELEEKVARLKARLHYQERTAREGFFGSSTPSSKVPIKPNTLEERQQRSGGGRKGHKGHGRSSISEEEADRVEHAGIGDICPDCGTPLEGKGSRARTVIDCEPVRMKKILYRLERKRCPRCKKVVSARPPGVLAKSLYGNKLLAYVAVQHYVHGNTLGQIERQTGVGYSSLIDAMHQLARRLKDVPEALIQVYRDAPVKHADETGWRTDGQNGYSWLFCTPDISIFRVRNTRSARVAREVLGEEPLPGVLVVDRYNGYNKMPCPIQYCYAHLLRQVKDLENEFPGNAEIKSFVEQLAPQLANAISLRALDITNQQFKEQAARTKRKIINITSRQARHPAIRKIQDIFREKAGRLYHWAKDRNVPADNNLAERELRPLVIARKISFGSQSGEGARTREILMTILNTLKKRTSDPARSLKAVLDKLAEDPHLDPYKLLFHHDTS
jgi:transposase